MVQAVTAVLESLSIFRNTDPLCLQGSLIMRWGEKRGEETRREKKRDLCKCDKLVILPALDPLKNK